MGFLFSFFAIVALFVVWILSKIIGLFFNAHEDKPVRNDALFDEVIKTIESNGGKVTYMNRNTGTISFKDAYGEHGSYQVYKGYNSHYKDTK